MKAGMKPIHGACRGRTCTKTYSSWNGMINRCYNPNFDNYKHYGGRGITVCDRWRHNFPAFLSDMGERPPGLTLDRIDNNGDYEPSNCRWSTRHVQMGNCRRNVYVTFKGERLILSDWAKRFGMTPKGIAWRLKNGIPFDAPLRAGPKHPPTGPDANLTTQQRKWLRIKADPERHRKNKEAQRKRARAQRPAQEGSET